MFDKKVEVQGPATYNGVPVNHPAIIAGIKTLTKQGHGKGHIMRVIGMPSEVVEKYMAEAKAEQATAKT